MKTCCGCRHVDAIRRAREGLAIGAMADPDRIGIDLGFEGNLSAVALAVDFHGVSPHVRLFCRLHSVASGIVIDLAHLAPCHRAAARVSDSIDGVHLKTIVPTVYSDVCGLHGKATAIEHHLHGTRG
jgi:hypothetical protein